MPANLKSTKKSELKPVPAANELAIKPTMLLVLGMHRSGTSVTARLLECLGAQNSGRLMPATEGNPHGYFEDQEIYTFNEGSLLPRLGRAWHSTGFVDWTSLNTADRGKYALQALEVLRKNYPLSNSLSVLKEPRIGILLPFWLSVFQHAGFNVKVVCAVRDPVSVIRSLSKAQGLSLTHGGMLFVNYWLSILSCIQDLPVAFVRYDEIFANPAKSLSGVAQKLALPFPEDFEEQVHRFSSSFFDKDLRHSSLQSQDLALEAGLPPLAIELYESLLAAADTQNVKKTAKIVEHSQKWMTALQPGFLEFDRLFIQFHSANQRANELNAALEEERSAGHRERLAEVAAEKEHLSQELARLVGEVAHHRDQLSHQSHELESLTHETSQQRQLVEDERARLTQEIENLREEGTLQQATIHELTQQKDTLSELIRQRDEECAHLKNNVKERFRELAELSKMYLASEERGRVAVANNIKLKKTISWKITALLRFPNQLLKKLSKKERVLRNQREIILKSGLFDEDFYLRTYPDVAARKLDPIRHYLLFGAEEGRNPSISFNTTSYLLRYADIRSDKNKINPLIHYILYGLNEKRLPY